MVEDNGKSTLGVMIFLMISIMCYLIIKYPQIFVIVFPIGCYVIGLIVCIIKNRRNNNEEDRGEEHSPIHHHRTPPPQQSEHGYSPPASSTRSLIGTPRDSPVGSSGELPESVSNVYQQMLNQEYANQEECIICWENVRSVKFNCGHTVVCHSCMKKVRKANNCCPICRQKIIKITEEIFTDKDFSPPSPFSRKKKKLSQKKK